MTRRGSAAEFFKWAAVQPNCDVKSFTHRETLNGWNIDELGSVLHE